MLHLTALGPQNSYGSQVAASLSENLESSQVRLVGTNPEIIRTILQDPHDGVGVIPVWNKYGGSVAETLESLYEHGKSLKIIGWVSKHINHVLAVSGESDANPHDLTKIYSHPQALIQCRQYLSSLSAEQIKAPSTAAMIPHIQKDEHSSEAVICSKDAAHAAQLRILDDAIAPQDNVTHFALVSRQDSPLILPDHLSHNQYSYHIVSSLSDEVGSLADLLVKYKNLGVSIHYIESMADGKG